MCVRAYSLHWALRRCLAAPLSYYFDASLHHYLAV